MHQCETLLGQILDLSRQEEKALEQEDVYRAEQLAEKRSQLLSQAWQARGGYDKEALWDTLLLIEAMQDRLHDMARDLHEKIAADLRDSRKRCNYFAGYRSMRSERKRANYCDEVS